jgi:glycosyltransferase involved in cell wall biosynthesis
LHSRGVEVELVTLGGRYGSGTFHEEPYRTTFVKEPANRYMPVGWTNRFRTAVRKALNTSKPVLLHDHGVWLPSNHFVADIARSDHVPLVISSRGMLSPWALNAKKWRKRIAWLFYQKRDLNSARMLHATSDGEAGELRALGLSPQIAIIPNGIELPPDNQESLSSRERIVLFLSRIHPKKGLLDLVQAWGLLRPRGWRVIVAGNDDGHYQPKVQAAAAAHGVERDFEFVGSIDDRKKWALYKKAHLFVLPSYSENFGMVIAEALACGVPVITTRATPWSELHEHRCGWWTETGVDALVRGLREAFDLNDAERREMGQRGRQLVATNYTWSGVAAKMCMAYGWLLENAAKPEFVS